MFIEREGVNFSTSFFDSEKESKKKHRILSVKFQRAIDFSTFHILFEEECLTGTELIVLSFNFVTKVRVLLSPIFGINFYMASTLAFS